MTSTNSVLQWLCIPIGLVSIGLAFYLSRFPYFSPAKWAKEIGNIKYWEKLSLIIFGISTAAIVGEAIVSPHAPLFALCDDVGVACMSVLFFYSFITDPKLRLVDRRLFNWAIPITFATALPFVLTYSNEYSAIAVAVVFGIGFFTLLFLFSLGPSDSKALILVSLTSMPITGFYGFAISVYLTCGVLLLTSVFLTIKGKKWRTEKWKIWKWTESLPAVPIILGCFWITLMCSPFIHYAAAIKLR